MEISLILSFLLISELSEFAKLTIESLELSKVVVVDINIDIIVAIDAVTAALMVEVAVIDVDAVATTVNIV